MSIYPNEGRERPLQPPEEPQRDYCEHGVEWEMPCGECEGDRASIAEENMMSRSVEVGVSTAEIIASVIAEHPYRVKKNLAAGGISYETARAEEYAKRVAHEVAKRLEAK